MDSLDKFLEVIGRLRDPKDGCPWDRVQTHKSIRGHLVEECAELLETIDAEDPDHMREELGDVLMHLALHARMEEEKGNFTFDDVVREITEKLVRRHPHVFGQAHADDSDDVLKIWVDVKKKEKADKGVKVSDNFFENIPPALSALRLGREVAKKLPESVKAEGYALAENSGGASAAAGAEIFKAVEKCVASGQEPEGALRDCISLMRKAYENERRKI